MKKKVLVEGAIGYVDTDANIIILKCSEPETREMEVLNIVIPSNAELKGIGSLFDLESGNEILAELYEDDVSGMLKASVIKLIHR